MKLKNQTVRIIVGIMLIILGVLLIIQNLNTPKQYSKESVNMLGIKSKIVHIPIEDSNPKNYLNNDNSYYIFGTPLSLTIIKEKDYIDSFKGQKLLGLKILDLSDHRINGSDESRVALKESVLEIKEMVLGGGLKNNSLGELYELNSYDKAIRNLTPIPGNEVENVIIEYLDEIDNSISTIEKRLFFYRLPVLVEFMVLFFIFIILPYLILNNIEWFLSFFED